MGAPHMRSIRNLSSGAVRGTSAVFIGFIGQRGITGASGRVSERSDFDTGIGGERIHWGILRKERISASNIE